MCTIGTLAIRLLPTTLHNTSLGNHISPTLLELRMAPTIRPALLRLRCLAWRMDRTKAHRQTSRSTSGRRKSHRRIPEQCLRPFVLRRQRSRWRLVSSGDGYMIGENGSIGPGKCGMILGWAGFGGYPSFYSAGATLPGAGCIRGSSVRWRADSSLVKLVDACVCNRGRSIRAALADHGRKSSGRAAARD
jgi:hypothetical protein